MYQQHTQCVIPYSYKQGPGTRVPARQETEGFAAGAAGAQESEANATITTRDQTEAPRPQASNQPSKGPQHHPAEPFLSQSGSRSPLRSHFLCSTFHSVQLRYSVAIATKLKSAPPLRGGSRLASERAVAPERATAIGQPGAGQGLLRLVSNVPQGKERYDRHKIARRTAGRLASERGSEGEQCERAEV